MAAADRGGRGAATVTVAASADGIAAGTDGWRWQPLGAIGESVPGDGGTPCTRRVPCLTHECDSRRGVGHDRVDRKIGERRKDVQAIALIDRDALIPVRRRRI